jgi:hypothetical protein
VRADPNSRDPDRKIPTSGTIWGEFISNSSQFRKIRELVGSDSARIVTTAPSKPSPQTTLVLAAMGEAAASTEASLQDLRATTESSIHELRVSLDLLHGNMARIDTTQ